MTNLVQLRRILFLSLCCSVLTETASAQLLSQLTSDQESTLELSEEKAIIHYFVSQGYLKTSDNAFIKEDTQVRPVGFTEMGFNLTRQISNDLRAGFQVYATNADLVTPNKKFDADLDWFYGDYHITDAYSIRFGRLKIPFGLYNEFHDVDAGRATLLLPTTVYPLTNRTFLLAQSGIEAYGDISTENWGTFRHRLYAGIIDIDTPSQTSGVTTQNISGPYLYGGRILWETPKDGLVLAYSLQSLRLDVNYSIGTVKNEISVPAVLGLGSIEYQSGDWTTTFEYGQWDVSVKSDNPTFIPDEKAIQEHYYLMFIYRYNDWVIPGAYYGEFYPEISKRKEKDEKHKDASLFIRFDLTPNWILKASVHDMQGTAGLNAQLNGVATLDKLDDRWQAFILKTTVFY